MPHEKVSASSNVFPMKKKGVASLMSGGSIQRADHIPNLSRVNVRHITNCSLDVLSLQRNPICMVRVLVGTLKDLRQKVLASVMQPVQCRSLYAIYRNAACSAVTEHFLHSSRHRRTGYMCAARTLDFLHALANILLPPPASLFGVLLSGYDFFGVLLFQSRHFFELGVFKVGEGEGGGVG